MMQQVPMYTILNYNEVAVTINKSEIYTIQSMTTQ